jgi:flagellar protein FlaH
MPKDLVLVAEDEPDIRQLLVDTLADAGFDVIEAGDGGMALEKARQERPDVVLLDVMMPVMDGFEVLGKLRQDPITRRIPVVMLTALSASEGERLGMELGVTHYLTKPLDHGVLEATLRVVLRERVARADDPDQTDGAIRTAGKLSALEKKLGGGLPRGSLTLLEGAASSGKSVLCQHLVFGAMESEFDTVYFSSEHTRESFITQMNSLGLNVLAHFRSDHLKMSGMSEPKEGEGTEPLLGDLVRTMEALPDGCKFIVVDSITNLASPSSESAVIAFFTACRRMCNKGRTVLVAIHSHAFGPVMFDRLSALCDTYLHLRSETLGGKPVKTVEVRKVNSSNLENNNSVSFTVVPNVGMKVMPISRTKV